MSTAIKNDPLYEDDFWVRDRQELISKGLIVAGSPWGKGFGLGLVMAFVILLPFFFAYVLIGGSIGERLGTKDSASATRDFSMMTEPGYRDYLER